MEKEKTGVIPEGWPMDQGDWRSWYANDPCCALDPYGFDSEAELFEALCHVWRKGRTDGAMWGVDPNDYDSEEEYDAALDAARKRWSEAH